MLELKEKCVRKETGEKYIISIKGGRNNSIEPDVKVCLFFFFLFLTSLALSLPQSYLPSPISFPSLPFTLSILSRPYPCQAILGSALKATISTQPKGL